MAGDVAASPVVHPTELVSVASLRAHPRNYRAHPPDQRRHIARSITEHGLYRNVVVADDGTILAGHGVVDAAVEAGLEQLAVVRLPYGPDDPRARQVLVGDNETSRLAEVDDRMLTDLLRELRDEDVDGLLGTGYDDQMLANLVFVTRAEGEIARESDAAAWVGLPEFNHGDGTDVILSVHCRSEDDRARLLDLLGLDRHLHRNKLTRGLLAVYWPPEESEDLVSLRFESSAG